ncbi:MAG: hypothetical protein HW413_61 [Thermoleophilia bacterium]|nr:hypothetical protein [Thermoleophilia bacterium]
MSDADSTSRSGTKDLTGLLTAAGYFLLGSILCLSRFAGLNQSYSSDELTTVRDYITGGPDEILIGHYVPNNHELFSLLGWATTSLFGESEIALRLWSAVPFVAGVILVTAWLHKRLGLLSGVLFLFFATASPLLLDITRQARGYGLAFLAMSVLTVAALEANRSPRIWTIVAFCGAGVVGTWTLPHFGIAFAATGAVLLTNRELRRRTAVGLTVSFLAIIAWYSPHIDDLLESSRQEYGSPIAAAWIITAPIDQTLWPALIWIDETLYDPGLGALAIVVPLALLIGSSPLLRSRDSSLILSAGVLATVITLWLTRTHVAPRFFSFLLVPLVILLASGIAMILARFATTRRLGVRTLIAVTTLGLVALISAPYIVRVTRLPRESTRDVAETIRALAPPSAPVFAHVPYPRDLEFYLGRPVETPRTTDLARRVCDAPREAVVITQPWILPPVTIYCTQRKGARHFRFRQYARGGEMNVWFVPPRS